MIKNALVLQLSLCLLVFANNAAALAGPSGGEAASLVPDTHRNEQLPSRTHRPAFYRTLAKEKGFFYRIRKDGCATSPIAILKACFNKYGAHIENEGTPSLSLQLVAYGRGQKLERITPNPPTIKPHLVTYQYGTLSEWWRVLPMGFEQGFTIAERPRGRGQLILSLATNDNARKQNDSLSWGKLRYGKLLVTDAKGHVVPSTLEHTNNHILIVINDRHAYYPVTVDPSVWLEQKVTPTPLAPGVEFGTSVASSGKIALIGSAAGAVFVFTKSGGSWRQTAILTAGKNFGITVALDGTTALIGAPQCYTDNGFLKCNNTPGAAYVVTESGGNWKEVAILTPTNGTGDENFGSSVAISGTTALVGASHATVNGNAEQGATYVFTDSGGSWSQTQELTASNGRAGDHFGNSIAVSGATALVGAAQANTVSPPYLNNQGAVYAFSDLSGTWAQTQELTPDSSGDSNADGYMFGQSIALSGTKALIGSPFEDTALLSPGTGAVYIFNDVGGTWTKVQKIPSVDGNYFGYSVGLSGSTALVGAPYTGTLGGTAYALSDSAGNWSQTKTFIENPSFSGDNFGTALAFSGKTGLIGAPNEDDIYLDVGVAYFETASNFSLTMNEPTSVNLNQNYVSQTIATNNTTVISPAVVLTVAVPTTASFISATSSQGSCSESRGVVNCDLGQINGNGAMASANLTLKAVCAGKTIKNTASIAANPPLTASAPTLTAGTQEPPVAYNSTLTADSGAPATGALKASDINCDPLTFSIVSSPKHGTLTLDNATGTYRYLSNGYNGSDSFTFKANDGQADSNIATVSITDHSPVSGGGGTGIWTLILLVGLVLVGVWPRFRRNWAEGYNP